MIVAADFDI
uniref:Uncharacterized protein n=1 Tax=Arundo donax TaxID=35708 RepID=A0A0A9CH37_ARUDO